MIVQNVGNSKYLFHPSILYSIMGAFNIENNNITKAGKRFSHCMIIN